MISWILSRWVYPVVTLIAFVASGLLYIQTMRVWSLNQDKQELKVLVQEYERGQALYEQLQQENQALRIFSLSLSEELKHAEDYNRALPDDFRGIIERMRSGGTGSTGFAF